MKNYICLALIFYSTFFLSQKTHLNIGLNDIGLCFGNPPSHNGIKINDVDKNVKCVNGINLAILSRAKTVNGLTVGLFAALDSCSNGVKISCFGSDAGQYHNGLVIAGLNIIGQKINGVGVALWTVSSDTMNGLFIAPNGGISKWSVSDTITLLNGVAVGALDVRSKEMNGVSLSLFTNIFNKMNGVSVSLINKTNELHGLQFGLVNYAGNNRPALQWMPFFNFQLKKDKKHVENPNSYMDKLIQFFRQ